MNLIKNYINVKRLRRIYYNPDTPMAIEEKVMLLLQEGDVIMPATTKRKQNRQTYWAFKAHKLYRSGAAQYCVKHTNEHLL